MFDPPEWGRHFNTLQDKPYIPSGKKEHQGVPIKPVCPEVPAYDWRPPTLEEQLRELHRRRVAAHPDSGGSHEEFLRVNAQYEALKRRIKS